MMDNPPPIIPPDMPALPASRAPMHPASVHCRACGTCVWAGGEVADDEDRSIEGLPFGDIEDRDGTTTSIDAQTLLTAHAEQRCTRDDCPHTDTALAAARAQDPAVLAEQIAALTATLARLAGE